MLSSSPAGGLFSPSVGKLASGLCLSFRGPSSESRCDPRSPRTTFVFVTWVGLFDVAEFRPTRASFHSPPLVQSPFGNHRLPQQLVFLEGHFLCMSSLPRAANACWSALTAAKRFISPNLRGQVSGGIGRQDMAAKKRGSETGHGVGRGRKVRPTPIAPVRPTYSA